MNLTPPMDPNAAPLGTLHRSRGILILLGFAAFMCLILALNFRTFGPLSLILVAIPVLAVMYCLFFQVQSVEFFPTSISLNSILRKRRIEHVDVDFVSMEERRTNAGGMSGTVKYVRVKLRSGRKIDLSGFQEPIETVYQKLKECESTNEEFLRGR